MAVVLDTSVLYALTDAAEPAHRSCVNALMAETESIIVPQVVLPEIAYLLASRLGGEIEARFFEGLLASRWRLEPLTDPDLPRALALLSQYADAQIGFVDACLVAVAERLGITRIYTLDKRHFTLIRPTHSPTFEVVPGEG